MKAWQVTRLGAPERALRASETAIPEPLPGFVRLRVHAAALSLPDVMMCRGSYQGMSPEIPFTPGLEAAGIVDAAPEELGDWVGRRAVGVTLPPWGGLAECALALVQTLVPVPDSLDDVSAAATLIAYQTAHQSMLRRGGLRAGETLLVHGGAGGVGSAAIQLGKALGARVLATAGGPAKTAFCKQLGADVAIDYSSSDFVEAVKAATDGRGVDVVYDPVGGEVGERSVECIAPEGRLLLVGFAAGVRPIQPLGILLGNVSVVGCLAGGFPGDRSRAIWEESYREVTELIERGSIRPIVGRTISFDEVPAALSDLAARRAFGRIVVKLHEAG